MNLVLELREKVPAREGKGFEENTLARVCRGVKDSDWNEKIVGLIETTFVRKVAIVGESEGVDKEEGVLSVVDIIHLAVSHF